MFLKKLMCLVLSLAFSISPILSNSIVFSSDSFDFLDLSDLSDDYYSGEEKEEEEEEEEEEEDSPCIEYDQEYQAEEALEISKKIVASINFDNQTVSSEPISSDVFSVLWNYVVKKYIFEPSYSIHGRLYFEISPLYLNDQVDIPEELFPILYNLAVQLKSCNQLCDKGDLLQITGILKMFSNRYCLEDSGSTLVTIEKSSGKSLIALPKFVNRKNDYRNSKIAGSIYEKILTTCTINTPNFFVNSWNMIVKKYVFDKCEFSHLCFEDSDLLLTDDFLSYLYEDKIEAFAFFVAKTLYGLTNHLLNSEELDEEREFINGAKCLAENLLINAGQYPSSELFSEIFQGSKERINKESAIKIYNEIYKFFAICNKYNKIFIC